MDDLGKIAFLAMVNEGLVEYFFGWAKEHGLTGNPMRWIAAGGGVIMSVGFGADLFSAFGLTAGIPLVGSVLTGLVIARGSDYLHSLQKMWRKG